MAVSGPAISFQSQNPESEHSDRGGKGSRDREIKTGPVISPRSHRQEVIGLGFEPWQLCL